MKYFCSKCGKTTQYNFELPKFCSSCGQSFASKPEPVEAEDKRNKFLNELKLKKNINSLTMREDIAEIETQISYLAGHFKKVKPSFKVDVYKSKGESFGSLLENPSKPIEQNEDYSAQTKSKEEILAEFQKEAGSLISK
jgi:ribosomal protein L37E